MAEYKQILCVLLFTISSGLLMAQNNTNSPYTRYGYGQLSDQAFGNSKGMGGVAYGLRDSWQINAANPASYTAVDSLTFLFDGGVSLQNANLSDKSVNTKINAKNSSVDYVAMQFRLHKRLGVTAGLLPYSNVGYNIVDSRKDNADNIYGVVHYGDGGLHQAFMGLGFKVLNNLSVGVNASYLWGDITKGTGVRFSDLNIYQYTREEGLSVSDIKFDVGAQYTHVLDKKNTLTLGAVFSPKHNLHNEAYLLTRKYTEDSKGNTADQIVDKKDISATFGLPMTIGAGLAYQHDKRWTVAADYTFQKWTDVKYMDVNTFANQSKIALGAEYKPNSTGRSYFSHVKYRFGGYYSTPYYKVENKTTGAYSRACSEYGLSAGVALPVPGVRSLVNISAQYINVSGKKSSMLDEKYLRLCIGITFNERWFFKRKVN